MLMLVLLALGGALGGGAVAYLTAPASGRCDDTLTGVVSSCVAGDATPGRVLLGALVGLLLPLLVVGGRRLVR